jgi:NADH dehydrogenase FAD-containing subunit
MRKRVVIAGFGDTGMLVAIHLGRDFDIVGITPKPCLLSGQELGMRLTRPQLWRKDYLMPFRRYPHLDDVRVLQGLASKIDTANKRVIVRLVDGSEHSEEYDALVISSGVTNGFWRNNAVEDLDAINRTIDDAAQQMQQAQTVAIVGGGATGVSVAANLAAQYPHKDVHLFFSQQQVLPGYHPNVRNSLEVHLIKAGVTLHPGHRAIIPPGFACDRLSKDALHWLSGQPPFNPDLALWAVGNTQPNNRFIPAELLTDDGFVKVDNKLRVPGVDGVFSVGDIAASDPNRSSARNWGYRLLAHNIRATFEEKPDAMKLYTAPPYRWGSILGVQADGLRVFQPTGGSYRFAAWTVKNLLFPLAVRKMIYRGVRKEP